MRYNAPRSIEISSNKPSSPYRDKGFDLSAEKYVHYTGRSMYPTFHDPEFVVIEKIAFEDLCPGDVIVYEVPHIDELIIHRIITREGSLFVTKGDNNLVKDKENISFQAIRGRAVGILKKTSLKPVVNGKKGLIWARFLFVRKWIKEKILAPIIWNPVARKIKSLLIQIVSIQPDYITYQHRDGTFHISIVWKKQIIGTYNSQTAHIRIKRRYRAFVNSSIIKKKVQNIAIKEKSAHSQNPRSEQTGR